MGENGAVLKSPHSITGTGREVSSASWSLMDAAAATKVAICVGTGVSEYGVQQYDGYRAFHLWTLRRRLGWRSVWVSGL